MPVRLPEKALICCTVLQNKALRYDLHPENYPKSPAILIFKPKTVSRKNLDMFHMTGERQKELWSDCIFVFDTSALLAFYLYPEEARQQIYKEIFARIRGRLWIPHHVLYEFHRNKASKIREPVARSYKPLNDEYIQPMIEAFRKSLNRVDALRNTIRKADSHPYMVAEELERYEQKLKEFVETTMSFGKTFNAQMEQKISEILQLEQHDTVLEQIEQYFKVGREYSYEEILKITVEGKHRYEYKIPPGYEDLKDKIGTQIFGDLIIWKQILEFAGESRKNIVFICNDLKEDWWQMMYEKGSGKKRAQGPRRELIKEIMDHAGSSFWMYNQARFLDVANTLIKANVLNRYIDQASRLLVTRALDKYLVYICDHCSQQKSVDTAMLKLDFELVKTAPEAETRYLAETDFTCGHCGSRIGVSFEVWEHPAGIISRHQCFLKGAALIRENPVEEEELDGYRDTTAEVEELVVIDKKQLRLRAGRKRRIVFPRELNSNNTLFCLELLHPTDRRLKKRIQIDAPLGKKPAITKTLVLDRGQARFVMRPGDARSDQYFSSVILLADRDMSLVLSVTEYPGTDRYLEKLFY